MMSKDHKQAGMKALLCLSSKLRTEVPICLQSIIDNVVLRLPERPDIIGHFPLPRSGDIDKLRAVSGQSHFVFEDDPVFPESYLDFEESMRGQPSGIKNNLLQWHSMKQCAVLAEKFCREKNYDLILWIRPDLYFFNEIRPLAPLEKDMIYISPHDSWSGYNDRYCYGPPGIMLKRMNLFDYFVQKWPEKIKEMRRSHPQWKWNPEMVLAGYLKEELGAQVMASMTVALRMRSSYETPYLLVPNPKGSQGGELCYGTGFDRMQWEALIEKLTALIDHPEAVSPPSWRVRRQVPLGIVLESVRASQK